MALEIKGNPFYFPIFKYSVNMLKHAKLADKAVLNLGIKGKITL